MTLWERTKSMLLLLSHFSCVWLCATPSLGFSRQEHWSRLPFPSPMQKSESEATQSCPTLHDPMDCSLPGSSIHGIFQARVLEWGAIAFSERVCYRGTEWGQPTQSWETMKCSLGLVFLKIRPWVSWLWMLGRMREEYFKRTERFNVAWLFLEMGLLHLLEQPLCHH